jgi:hypothetical protein
VPAAFGSYHFSWDLTIFRVCTGVPVPLYWLLFILV